MFQDITGELRRRKVGDEPVARPSEPGPRLAASREAAEPPLSHETIRLYLTALGLGDVDPARERIDCWTSLQAFVATRIAVAAVGPSNNMTRLKLYGLEKSHPVKMFIRYVIS